MTARAGPAGMAPQHLAFILFIDILWAANLVATKEAVSVVPPLLATALRFAIVLAVCVPHMRLVPGRMGLIVGTGLVAGALHFGLGSASIHLATNLSALAIVGQLGVPFSLLLAILIDGERIAWRRTLGIVLAFAGVTLLVFDPTIADEQLAILLTAGAALCWGAATLMFRRLAGVHVLNLQGWQAIVSLPALLAASALLEPGAIAAVGAVPLSALGWIAYSALAASLIGHAGMSWMLQRYPVTSITPLTLPTPLLAVIIATAVYGTPVTLPMIVGGLMTLAGVAIIALRSAARMETGRPEKKVTHAP
ncbi:MAG: DMT family transporter [Thermaurantiacus sp.]